MASQHEQRSTRARQILIGLIEGSAARPAEKRAQLAMLEELWLTLVDDAPVYPSPLGAWRRKDLGR